MNNSEACDHFKIKSSLFPLDKKEAYEPRIIDQSINHPYKPVIFQNNIHHGAKSNFTPVATPMKQDHYLGVESVMKTPYSNEIPVKGFASNLASPSYEKALAERIKHNSEVKPIFESTIKQNHQNSLIIFSPTEDKPFTAKKENKRIKTKKEVGKQSKQINFRDRSQTNTDIKGPILPITKMGCNCKNSQCLKLYCECFRNQTLCKNCSCKNCSNHTSNSMRKNAILAIKSKNPNAFDPKFKTTQIFSVADDQVIRANKMAIIISRGCKCKNSNCKKKYCECYQYGLGCSDKCKCSNCENGRIKTKASDDRADTEDKEEAELNKRDYFDIKSELTKKLLEIKKLKLRHNPSN